MELCNLFCWQAWLLLRTSVQRTVKTDHVHCACATKWQKQTVLLNYYKFVPQSVFQYYKGVDKLDNLFVIEN